MFPSALFTPTLYLIPGTEAFCFISVYFNPLHEDVTSPGLRDGSRYCALTYDWAFDNTDDISWLQQLYRPLHYSMCKASMALFWILSLGLLELLLYAATFWKIVKVIIFISPVLPQSWLRSLECQILTTTAPLISHCYPKVEKAYLVCL